MSCKEAKCDRNLVRNGREKRIVFSSPEKAWDFFTGDANGTLRSFCSDIESMDLEMLYQVVVAKYGP